MNASIKSTLWATALSLCLAAPAALAQDATAQDSTANQPQTSDQDMGHSGMSQGSMQPGMHAGMHPDMQAQHHGMKSGMYGNVMGRHTMPAVVDSVDPASGIVLVTSEHMQLKLHFPPSSLTNLSAGDHITLHLAFSK